MWMGLEEFWPYEPSGVLRISERCSCIRVSTRLKTNISSEGLAVAGAHSVTLYLRRLWGREGRDKA